MKCEEFFMLARHLTVEKIPGALIGDKRIAFNVRCARRMIKKKDSPNNYFPSATKMFRLRYIVNPARP